MVSNWYLVLNNLDELDVQDQLMPGVLGPLQGRSQGACGQGRGQGWSSGPKSGADAGKGTRAGKGPGVTGTGLVTFEVVKCDKHI